MTERTRLPDRRPARVQTLDHDGHPFTLSIGFHPETGLPMEVFADAEKFGTVLAHILADDCVVISLALQHGATPAGLVKSLGRVPDPVNGEEADKPASVIGTIVEVLVAEGGGDA